MTANDTHSALITPMEAARRLGIDRVAKDPKRTVMTMARNGELESVRVARWVMITRSSVDRMISGGEVDRHEQITT